MKLDPRNLRVADALRLLNSTPLGEVVQPHLIYRHVQRAGFRIGDGKKIDLARYTAWLFQEREAVTSAANDVPAGSGGYVAHKEAVNARGRIDSESARDIAPGSFVHQPRDAARRESCRLNFRAFCEAYFQPVFSLAWSDDHLKVIARIESAVLEGGLFAMAMPRSSGKTSLCETACLWALLYGHGRFVVLIAADARLAQQSLESIKDDLVKNDLLEEDFSEVVGPIRALEGIHQRAAGQLYQGRPTYIAWTANEVVLPSIPGSEASGGVIRVTGVTGSIRGMKCRRPDGTSARPDLVLIDDPQTDESARSPEQCADREQVISGAILGLAGPEKSIAALMTLTVVRPGDLADRILDPAIHPSWQGQRTKMVYAFPTNVKLWDEYFRLRSDCLRNGTGLDLCNRFYTDHQTDMDQGAAVAWQARYGPNELSAIQHAMNLRFRVKEAAFAAEYQNDPLPPEVRDKDVMTAQQIAAKVNGLPRKVVPVVPQFVTGFVDVQQEVLYYLVAAWEPNFTGYVVDYGTWPDQGLHYFTSRELTARLGDNPAPGVAEAVVGGGIESGIFRGLNALLANVMDQAWPRQDGMDLHLNRCLVDAGYKSDVIYEVCRQHPNRGRLLPTHGRSIGASNLPFEEWSAKPGERMGHHWIVKSASRRAIRYGLLDVNYWKSFVHARLAVPQGDPGCLSLFAPDRSDTHRLLADHLTAEYRVQTAGRGRRVDEWKIPPAKPDNHWFDALVGAAAAASMEGVQLREAGPQVALRTERRRVKLSDLQAAARARRELAALTGAGASS